MFGKPKNNVEFQMQMANLSASLEDYLKVIYLIVRKKHAARPKDISKRLEVSNPSVTAALKTLSAKGLVRYAPYDVITLTKEGGQMAAELVRRHESLRDFFCQILSVKQKSAEDAACKLEHAVPREILERIILFSEFVETCPRTGKEWLAGFDYYWRHGGRRQDCTKCPPKGTGDVDRGVRSKENGSLPLTRMRPGQKGTVTKIRARGEVRSCITAKGVNCGVVVKVEEGAQRGNAVNLEVRGYHISLSSEEARKVEATPI